MRTRRSAIFILLLLGSFLLAGLGPSYAAGLLEDEGAPVGQRALAVILGVGSHLPWLGLAALITLRSDEYAREQAYQAMGVGLGLAILVLALFDFLALAGFIGWTTAPAPWQTVILCWGLGFVVVRVRRALQA